MKKNFFKYILEIFSKLKRLFAENNLTKTSPITDLITSCKPKLLVQQANNLHAEIFWLIYQRLNSQRFSLLNLKQSKNTYQRITNTLSLLNQDYPNFRANHYKISTLPLPFIKNYVDTKRKANLFFRKELKRLFPDQLLSLIAVAELYKCFHQCHWKNVDLTKEHWGDHDKRLCWQLKQCRGTHWTCEKGFHFPVWHSPDLDLRSWPHGKVHVKNVLPDRYGLNQSNDYDIDVKLSYFLKNYIEIQLNPELFRKKKFNPKGIYYHRFNEVEDLAKRTKNSRRNKQYHLQQKHNISSEFNRTILLMFEEEPIVEIKQKSLIKKRKRVEQKLKTTNRANSLKYQELKLKLKAYNFLLKSNWTSHKLTPEQEWIWRIFIAKK